MSDIGTDRRTMLALLAAGAVRSRVHAAETSPLLFLNSGQHQLVAALVEMILPADNHSPGAREAGVSRYIDLVLANSGASAQDSWKQEMEAFEVFARQHGETPFLDATPAARSEILNLLASKPEQDTPAGRFFARTRQMTIFGYYSSKIGLLNELEYQGNQVMAGFPGCERR